MAVRGNQFEMEQVPIISNIVRITGNYVIIYFSIKHDTKHRQFSQIISWLLNDKIIR